MASIHKLHEPKNNHNYLSSMTSTRDLSGRIVRKLKFILKAFDLLAYVS